MTEMMSKIINIPGGLTWDNAPVIVHDFLVSEMIFSVMVIVVCIGLSSMGYHLSNYIEKQIDEEKNKERIDGLRNINAILIIFIIMFILIAVSNMWDIIQMIVTPSIYVLNNYKW